MKFYGNSVHFNLLKVRYFNEQFVRIWSLIVIV
jgi:hypothetical protein